MSSNPKTLDLGLRRNETPADSIRRLLPTIEHYRKQNHPLSAIYKVLLERGEIQVALQTFKNHYYRERKSIEASKISTQDASIPADMSVPTVERMPEKGRETAVKSKLNPTQKVRELELESLSWEEELQVHQEQAKAYFDNK